MVANGQNSMPKITVTYEENEFLVSDDKTFAEGRALNFIEAVGWYHTSLLDWAKKYEESVAELEDR